MKTHRENVMEDGGRHWSVVSPRPGVPSMAGNTRSQEKSAELILPWRLQREHGLADTLILDFQSAEL